jgi:hypothetical protein
MSHLIPNLKCHIERIPSRRSSLQKITVKDSLYRSQFHLKQSKVSSGRLLTLLRRAGEYGHEAKKTKKGAIAPKDLIETTGNYSLINTV